MKNRIRVLRAERDWSQADLASCIQVSRNSVVSIENGKHDPSIRLAFKIADVFGVAVTDVFQREEDQ